MTADTNAASTRSTFPIVGVGASAGGLEAFADLLRNLPDATGAAFVLIQHLDPAHPSLLREALARTTKLPVEAIRDGLRVEPNHIYVTPSNADIGILKGTLNLVPRPTNVRGPHLPIDFFFKALASDRTNQAIGVVLSGTGSDGTEGLREIKAEGGVTFVQDPHAAKFPGMPQAAIGAGLADFVLPLPELARELGRVGKHPFLARPIQPSVLASPSEQSDLDKVLVILRAAVGVDFSDYKVTSIRRRLARRMAVHRLTELHEYVQLLRDDPAEASALFDDLLIHVTSFFRDPDAFEKLSERVFPEILQQKRHGGTIRVWCAGCSTGEEAYGLAIALREFLARENALDVPIQIFASDVSEKAIAVARTGLYSEASVRDIGSERLARYFTRVDGGGYQIAKAIRERCAFVKHDLASDPPFSKLDLVTCRNVLIYFDPDLQKRVLGMFHFALNYPGFLLLGRAENIPDGGNLFTSVDPDAKIFARTGVKSALRFTQPRDALPFVPSAAIASRAPPPLDSLLRQAESRLLDQYAPPGVFVNDRMEIVRFRGRTGPYLEPPSGDPQHDLLKMARPGLVADLRIAIAQAKKEATTVRRTGVRIDSDGLTRVCDVVVIPVVLPPEARDPLYAVLFEDRQLAETPAPAGSATPARRDPDDDRRSAKLETELSSTKAYLQSVIEEHQETNDELMSANEELMSSNEELQSLNEELETAKEELQSTNEELQTLNEELQTRNVELDAVNGDLINILGSVEVPIVIVDGKRKIRRFTPKARPILNLLASDVGRPIDDIKPRVEVEELDRKIADVIDTTTAHEEEVRGPDGQWFRLQIRPYVTVDKRIDGAVISVIDIDVLKRALGAAEWARDYARATVEAVRMPLVILDEHQVVVSVNESFRARYAVDEFEPAGRSLYALQDGAWDLRELRSALERLFESGEWFAELELRCELPRLGPRTLAMSGRAVAAPGAERLVLLAIDDVTERRRGEAQREQWLADAKAAEANADAANRSKDDFLAMLSHELRTPLSSMLIHAQLMIDGKSTDETMRKSAEAVERAATAQAQLIDDLLDVSRIAVGKLRMDMMAANLPAIVRAAVELVRASADRKHLTLELEIDDHLPAVVGDPRRLQQAVWNLLTNAIKFTPQHGRVSVTVEAAGDRGRIQVRDTGVGIDPDFLPHVFQRFRQEERVLTRSVGGLGLGLGIVRYVIEAHGGTVDVASAGKGTGTTFTILLPLMVGRDKLTLTERPSPETKQAIENARILVVEDDAGTREALTTILGLAGAVVQSAASAAAAMTTFEELRPELLVCDIAMPDEDGYSLLRRIRALGAERGGNVPALALTALASDEDRRRAAEAGFQAHMTKPVDVDRLLAALGRLRASPQQRALK